MKHANILYSIEKVVMDICTKIMAMQLYPSQISLYIDRYIDIPIYVQMIDIQIYRQIPRHKDRYIDRYIRNTSEIKMYDRYLYIVIQIEIRVNGEIDRNIDIKDELVDIQSDK